MKKVLSFIVCLMVGAIAFSQPTTGQTVRVHTNGNDLSSLYGYMPDSVVCGTVQYVDSLMGPYITIQGYVGIQGNFWPDHNQGLYSIWYEEFGPEVSDYNDGDLDNTNELQTLSLSNDTLRLTDGGEVILPSASGPSINSSPGRSTNSNFTVGGGGDEWVHVHYYVLLSTTVSLVTGTSQVDVYLEYSTDAGSNWTQADHAQKRDVLSIVASLLSIFGHTTTESHDLEADGPPGALWRLRVPTVTGSASATYDGGQESIH